MLDRTVEFRSQLWKERDLVLCQRALFFPSCSFVLPFLTILLLFRGPVPSSWLLTLLSFTCGFSFLPDSLPETRHLACPGPLSPFLSCFSSRMTSPFSPFPALFCALPRDPWLPSLPVSLSPPPVSGPCPSPLLPVPRVLALVPAALQMHAFCFLAARVPAAPLWPAQERWAPSSPGPGPVPVWAAMEMKGVLGFSVPRLVCARPLCGETLRCHWESA